MLAKNICGLAVSFEVTGSRSWSFQTPNLEVFKPEQEKLFVLISIILCADSVATYASLDQILKCLRRNLRLCFISVNLTYDIKVVKINIYNFGSYIF